MCCHITNNEYVWQKINTMFTCSFKTTSSHHLLKLSIWSFNIQYIKEISVGLELGLLHQKHSSFIMCCQIMNNEYVDKKLTQKTPLGREPTTENLFLPSARKVCTCTAGSDSIIILPDLALTGNDE